MQLKILKDKNELEFCLLKINELHRYSALFT